jgi:hypothetical protein
MVKFATMLINAAPKAAFNAAAEPPPGAGSFAAKSSRYLFKVWLR